MKHKLRSFIACLLCLFQCVMLFSSDVLAAMHEGGDISSSFTFKNNGLEITVIDRYYNSEGLEHEDIREKRIYAKGDSYSYNALEPEGYTLGSDASVSGTADMDKEIVFVYQKQLVTIVVKDRFYSEAGVEERTDIRQEDIYEYEEYYDYSPLDPVPDGYVYLEDYDELLYGDEDGYYETSGDAVGDREIIFSYQKKPGCTITVKDKYVDRFGAEIKTDIRGTENKYLGEEYSYDCTSYDKNEYTVVGGHYDEWGDLITSQSGTVTGDLEIVFTYQKIAEAYVTVSYSEALCDYLNEHKNSSWDAHVYSPDEEVEKFKVVLGKRYNWDDGNPDFEIEFENIRDDFNYPNISSLHTCYYTNNGWSSDYYYLGFPVDGAVSKDPYLSLMRNDEEVMDSDIFQYCTRFGFVPNFPSDLPVDPDTDVCCHIVLDIDGFNFIETIQLRGVYRTVIDTLDADARSESWYSLKNPDDIVNNIKLASDAWGDVQKRPDDFEFVESGTTLMRWDDTNEEGDNIYEYDEQFAYRGKDKSNNMVFVKEDGTPFKVMVAPEIEDYLCTNPDSPREFECIIGWDQSAYCFYYDYIYAPSYKITVKDKFVDEEGVEERTDTRKEDKIPEDEEYTYKALDPIPDGYKLISDPTVTDTSKEDKEIVFVYQKLHQYTITVKDVFTNEAGVEENTAIRQEDKLYEDSSYHYSALSPVPDGYELVSASNYAGKASKDMEIVFTYRKKIVVPNTFNVVVKDKYIDTDGSVIRIDERVNTVLNLNDEYNFTALNPVPEGYEVVGASGYAGRVTENMDIMFVYQKKPVEKPATYTFKVVDEYYDADGNIIKTVERTTDTLEEGSSYVCTALKPVPDGYVLISDEEYRGIISEDTTIVFKYKDASVRFVTVKGYLKYKNGEPAANKKVEIHSTVRNAVTDAEGYYEIRNIETGSHKYTVFNDDGTDLITCDLNFTKSGQDTAEVTYKMKDVDVSIDLSTVDVLEIDAVLPLYKLEVYDKYYDEDGQLVKSELRESLTAVKVGTAYSYDALSPEGYSLTSKKNYSGVVTSDMTVIFTYKKDKKPEPKPEPKPDPDKPTPDPKPTPDKPSHEPEKKSYKVTVIDNFYDVNALLIGSSVRLTEIKTEGDAYYYEAKPVPNFTLIGADHYSSYVYSDITLSFAYKAIGQPKDAIITVIDRFVDEDGSTEDKIRITEDKKVGDPYHYEAIPVEGYDIEGSSSYSGVVTGSFTLIFTYQKTDEDVEKAANEFTVTVVDKFITDIPVNEFIIDKSEQTGISDGLNNFNTFHYAKENGKYIYMVRREVRCKDMYTEGSLYKYSALEYKRYTCISDAEYSGVVNGDIELEFVYARSDLTLQDIPDDVYTSKPDYPDTPEAKTGDLDETSRLPYMIVISLFIVVIVAAWVGRRKYYR